MTPPILRVRGAGWQWHDVTVLRDVSFDVAPGEFVAVMGRNGAGKSTLLDLIAALRSPSSGGLELAGRPLDDWPPRRRARLMAHLPQHLHADPAMRAESFVLMGRYPHATGWLEADDDRAAAAEAMRRCDCVDFGGRTLGSLSGGERQRVFLAACLAQQPRLLLLDEPATFLDVDQQLQAFEVLRAEAARGVACIAVTHDLNLALAFCSRLILLADRTIARDLTATAALDSPEWLSLLSARLAVETGIDGHRWVQYR